MRHEVADLLRVLDIRATRRGAKWFALCPSPAHDDTEPSWVIYDRGPFDRGSGYHKCLSCGFSGGPWELAQAVRGLATAEEGGAWIRAALGSGGDQGPAEVPRVRIVNDVSPRGDSSGMTLPWGVQIPSLDGSPWFEPARAYLESRRIPQWQVERWHIGYAIRGRCRMRVVVPVHTGGRLLSYVARAFVDGVPRYDAARESDRGARPDAAIWGEPGWEPDVDVVTVTEGVFKALAMERAGAPNPCAILGASNLGPEKIDAIARFATVLVATDPDRAGDRAWEEIRDSCCRYSDVRRVRLRVAPDDASDEENATAISRGWAPSPGA